MADRDGVRQAIIIGAGTAGLCAAHALRDAGIDFEILERAGRPGESWRGRHPRLTMNTHRDLSHLPNHRFPKGTPSFAPRDTLVTHIEQFVEKERLPITYGVTVEKIRREDRIYYIQTDKGLRRARNVIIATGRDRKPAMPEWPGMETFTGEIIHASRFGDAADYEGKSVLVVGAGNSGFDILNHLVRVHAAPIWLAVRRAPAVLPRRLFGVTVHRLTPVMSRLPVPLLDSLLALTQHLAFGNLTRLGFPREAEGGASRLRNEQVALAVDEGAIAAIRRGRISLVPPVRAFCGGSVILADDSRVSPEVVIAATGYTPGLEDLLKDFDVLDPRGFPRINGDEQAGGLPGLWFIGMRASLLGDVGSARLQARAIAKRIAQNLAVSA